MIPVPENVRALVWAYRLAKELERGGGRLLQFPPARPCESLSHSCPGLRHVWGGDCGALGHRGQAMPLWQRGSGLPEAHRHTVRCRRAEAVGGQERQGGWVLSCSLLVAGSDLLDLTPWGWLWDQGVYFSPLACSPQTRRRRWPCGQGMLSVRLRSRPIGLQGKHSEGQEGETKCREIPRSSGSCWDENRSVMFVLLAFPPPPQHTQHCIKPLWDLLGLRWTSLQTHWPTFIMASHLTFRPLK